MIQNQGVQALFWYVYRPMGRAAASGDGGFTLTLYENDTLTYTVFGPQRNPLQSFTFALPQEIRLRLMDLMDASVWWMQRMPLNMRAGRPPQSASLMGFYAQPMFVVEDLEETAFSPFATQRGHSARRLYLMLEDVSELLAGCGLYLEPARFSWNQQLIMPLPLSFPQGPYDGG